MTKKHADWSFEITKKQKKQVKAVKNNQELIFESSYACDKYFSLWRGCTSNSIRNMKGIYDDIYFCYV